MITTTKEEIRKAVIEALEEEEKTLLGPDYDGVDIVEKSDFPSVADLVAETLGGEGWVR